MLRFIIRSVASAMYPTQKDRVIVLLMDGVVFHMEVLVIRLLRRLR